MTWKTLALAGTATFALMASSAAFAQNDPAATTPAAAPAATDAAAPAATEAPAMPAKKHHKHHKKAAASTASEEQTTARLNQEQAEKPGSTPTGTNGANTMGNDTATPPASSSTAPGTTGTRTKPMDDSNAAQNPLMGGQHPLDSGNNANPAAQSDKMGNGDVKADDMKKDMQKKKDDATTVPPATTNPMP